MNRGTRIFIIGLAVYLFVACAMETTAPWPPLRVVSSVDLQKYTGVWYEIARYPHRFQKGCYGSTATYTLREDGRIQVLNECLKGGPDGERITAEGTAWVVERETNAKLKVSFFWPFSGDYWIIDLGEQYDYAVIGHPKRKYLWILSRTKEMEDDVYSGILERLREQQYDTTKLIRTS